MTTTLSDVMFNSTSRWSVLDDTSTYNFSDVTFNSTSYSTPGLEDSSTEGGTPSSPAPPAGCMVFPFSTFSPWNNPEDLVSRDTQQLFNKVINVYLLTLLFFVSVPGNVVNMIVYWRQGLKERINLCLFCLSFADFVTVFTHFEWNLDGLYAEVTGSPYRLVVMKFNVNNMIHSLAAFIYISGFLSLLIAFERFLCVAYPLKALSMMRTRTTLVIIVAGHVIIFAGHYLIATRWRVVCMYDPLIGQTVDTFYSGQFYLENKKLVDVFESIVFGILLPGICVTGVLVFTAIIVIKLRQMAEWRHSANAASASGSSSNVKDVALTRMLVGTSVLYVICTTPPLIFHAALPAVPELSLDGKYYNTYYLLINMQQFFTYINASVNFFIYYVFGTKFRCGVKKLFGCGAKLGRGPGGGARYSDKKGKGSLASSSVASSTTRVSSLSASTPAFSSSASEAEPASGSSCSNPVD